MTDAERTRKHRAARAAEGVVLLQVWVNPKVSLGLKARKSNLTWNDFFGRLIALHDGDLAA